MVFSRQFCDTPLWDYNLTWNTSVPDLTPCFQSTVLVWVPCAIFLVLAPYELIGAYRRPRKPNLWSKIAILKTVLNTWLLALACAMTGCQIYQFSLWGENLEDSISSMVSSVVELVIYVFILTMALYIRKRGVVVSKVLSVFWFLQSLSLLIRFYSSFLHENCERNGDDVACAMATITRIMFPTVVIQSILSAFIEPSSSYREMTEDDQEDNCQLKNSSFFSCLFFTWMTRLIVKGAKKKLENDDIPTICRDFTSCTTSKIFDEAFSESVHVFGGSIPGSDETTADDVRIERPKHSLLFVMLKTSWWPFLMSTITELLYIFFSLLPPLLLKLILNYVQSSEEHWHGYVYAVGFYFTVIFKSVLLNTCQYFSAMASISIQTSLTSAIYKKIFRFDNSGKKQYTTGELVNLISVDALEIITFTTNISSFWGIPLQIAVTFYFLWQILGISSLGTIVVIVLLSPISLVIGKYVEKLQIAIMARKDERLKEMSEILNGIKVLKLYAWEKPFMKRVLDIRDRELRTLKISCYIYALMTFLWSSASYLIILACFTIYILTQNQPLDVQTIFVSLSYITLLHVPIMQLPNVAFEMIRASVSFGRVREFLYSKDLDPHVVGRHPETGSSLTIEDATFSWSLDKDPILHNLTLNVPEGSLVAVVGSVGCGKSSLFSAILGDMKKISGQINIEGSIGYVPQQAWIQNATLQKNITFVKDLEERRYNKIIKACALKDDLEILPGGDQVEIGEKGINLSGGQKQRISLARAVYQDVDVYLLDDPLSAVDANVASHLFQEVIGPKGLLSGKTRILATHSITFLPKVDLIFVIEDGRITEKGTYSELMQTKGSFRTFLTQHLGENLREKEEPNVDNAKDPLNRQVSVLSAKGEELDDDNDRQRLIEEEGTEYGRIKWKIYKGYVQKVGVPLFILTMISFLGSSMLETGSGLWLSHWSSNTDGDQSLYLGVYGGVVGVNGVWSMIAYGVLFYSCVKVSGILHNELLHSVMKSPLSFFDTTPMGRILNRFSQDIEALDQAMPFVISFWINCVFYIIAQLAIIAYASPYILIVVILVFIIYLCILKVYINSSNQLQRLDSVSKSPIYSNFSETLAGVTSIRAFCQQNYFIDRSNQLVDKNMKFHYFSNTAGRWLDITLTVASGFIILASTLTTVIGKDTVNAGLIGLVLNYCVQISDSMGWVIIITSQLENQVVSVERINEYSLLPPEAEWDILESKPKSSWPEEGALKFDNFSVSYREGLDPVLKDINLKIEPRTKVGIVGRTGAGKSSLILSLFRIMEPLTGKIEIDNLDISRLGLYDLRSKLTVIPQDPVLFAGTLRMNLDPWDERSDDDIWVSLERAHLKTYVTSLSDGLSHIVTEGGNNLSAGQKQLICLARALLRHTKILILDEATASVDLDTDQLIQATIREAFSNSTIITIAHRLNTIMDYDRIIVLAQGQVVEEGSPETLMQNSETQFYSMAKDAELI